MQTPKQEIRLTPAQSQALAALYRDMETRYTGIAGTLGLSCANCQDNCCDSYFLHYTYAEWAYLWEGLRALDGGELARIRERAKRYLAESQVLLARGERPQLMCPLNDNGLCSLYGHRLMICRLHGIPAAMHRPDGQSLRFPGCFLCQEIVEKNYGTEAEVPRMDRTQLLATVAGLESELLCGRRHLYPKVKRTIAEMIAGGPPMIDKPFCAR